MKMSYSIGRPFFEITNQCNLNCKFCYNKSSFKNSGFMSIENFRTALNNLLIYNIKEVAISGGEPLLHPQILSILELIKQYNLQAIIITNGMYVNEKIIEFLINGIGIQVSLDGATEETDDNIRTKGHFKKVISVFQRLKECNYKLGRSKMTISKINYKETEEFIELCANYGIEPYCTFAINTGRANSSWNELKLSIKEKLEVIKIAQKYATIIDKPKLAKSLYPCGSCPLDADGLFNPLIKYNGNIQPCELLYDDKYSIGNIFNSNEFDSEKVNLVIKNKQDWKSKMDNSNCKNCSINTICKSGCFGEYACGVNEDDCELKKILLIDSNYKEILERVH